jgi:hypothetical protein
VLLDDDTELAHDFFVRHDLLADPRKCVIFSFFSLEASARSSHLIFRLAVVVGGYCVGIAINRQPPTNVWEIVSRAAVLILIRSTPLLTRSVRFVRRPLISSTVRFLTPLELVLPAPPCLSATGFVPCTSWIS